MGWQDLASQEQNAEWRFGANGSAGETSEESTDDEELGAEDGLTREEALRQRRERHERALAKREEVDKLLRVPRRRHLQEVMTDTALCVWESALRDAQDAADNHRRWAMAIRHTYFTQREQQALRRAQRRAQRLAERQEKVGLLRRGAGKGHCEA